MRLFYKNFPICDTLRHKLSWSHYRRLISVENGEALKSLENNHIASFRKMQKSQNKNCRPAT